MDELLMRYIKGDSSPEERKRVIAWLDEDSANMQRYRVLRKLYTLSLWSVKNEGRERKRSKLSIAKSYGFFFLKIAAVLLVGFFGASLYKNIRDTGEGRMQTVFVPAGQRAELCLADGTRVWLNSCSTLRFPSRFSEVARNVELDGEGYFEVTRDEKAPFTVRTSFYDIKVLGTAFNVKAYKHGNLFETALFKGSVKVTDCLDNKSWHLNPDEMVCRKGAGLIKKAIDNPDSFRWKEGLLCFDDERIGSLIEKLELYYGVKIVVRQPGLLEYEYSGKFRLGDGVEHILKVLQLKHKFRYVRDERENTITIN